MTAKNLMVNGSMYLYGAVGESWGDYFTASDVAMALADHGRHLGSASAMLGTMIISCGALSGLLVSLWHTDSPVPLSIVLGICGSLAWLAGRIARRT